MAEYALFQKETLHSMRLVLPSSSFDGRPISIGALAGVFAQYYFKVRGGRLRERDGGLPS